VDTVELEGFLKRFSTFFDEFAGEVASTWIFYLIFVIRRFSMTFIIIFISDPLIQLCLSVIFCLFVSSI